MCITFEEYHKLQKIQVIVTLTDWYQLVRTGPITNSIIFVKDKESNQYYLCKITSVKSFELLIADSSNISMRQKHNCYHIKVIEWEESICIDIMNAIKEERSPVKWNDCIQLKRISNLQKDVNEWETTLFKLFLNKNYYV